MLLSRLLTVPALALRTTAATAGVLARIAEDAATNLARTSADRAEGREAATSPDFLDLSDGAVPAYGAARLARSAPALSALSDGAAAEARLKGGTASDEVTAGTDEEAATSAVDEATGGRDDVAPAPPSTAPARENPRPRAFDPARITSMPVREALRVIDHLSTDELHAVLDHEAANRNRKSIIRAVERTLTAPAETGAPR